MQLKLERPLATGRRLDDDFLDHRADRLARSHCAIPGQVVLNLCYCVLVDLGVVCWELDHLSDRSGFELLAQALFLNLQFLQALHYRLRDIVIILDLANELADASLKLLEFVLGIGSAMLQFRVCLSDLLLQHPSKASDQVRGEKLGFQTA
ncbi:hypothetical protein OMW55_07405 [Sphingomonas sp. BN140010]|uniref:Uncharacterized protein n=1 Tax=Sphingomonas arvum TaxID=2992113 RepID=A0ABT3JEX8_9SPHN|nr:hypothetical protein [Sphingomonas sp. BN140010]MCW3797628.1 hypothetical protein [Sphingomonas sp. BN140010]